MKAWPAQTRHSLLASATVRPSLTAAWVGRTPAVPAIPATTMSAGRCAASMTASSPAAARDSSPRQRIAQRRKAVRIGESGEAGANADRRCGERRDVPAARYRLDTKGSPLRLQDLHGGAADRARGAEQRNGCRHWSARSARRVEEYSEKHADRPEGIQPVHDSAMSWNQMAGILHMKLSLQRGFQQVAALGDDGARRGSPR